MLRRFRFSFLILRIYLNCFGFIALLLALIACQSGPSAPDAALNSLQANAFMSHIRKLASDEFQGRLPGTRGEELTVKYLEEQFKSMGLEPGNPDGSYVQKVPLVGITADPNMTLALTGRGRAMKLKYLNDFVAATRRVTDTVSVEGDLIFVGYGVQAPEFQWDDFKGVDVKGKVVVVLVNDPPVPSAADPAQLDPKVFGGKAMTYYGRWTYKFEKAAQLGAAGCLIIHETAPPATAGAWCRTVGAASNSNSCRWTRICTAPASKAGSPTSRARYCSKPPAKTSTQ